jgi:endonuclease YncB( thermonuclease family)
MKKLNYIALIQLATSLVGCSSIPRGQYEDTGYYGHGGEDIFVKERGAKIYSDIIVSKVVSVYDGDTMRVNLKNPKGVPSIIADDIPIRFDGIDTPEIRGNSRRLTKIALEARDYTIKRLNEADKIVLTRVQRRKYFRILAEVEVDGVNLNQELIDKGLARPYFGGSKVGLWDNRFRINRIRLERQEGQLKNEKRKESVRKQILEKLKKSRELRSKEKLPEPDIELDIEPEPDIEQCSGVSEEEKELDKAFLKAFKRHKAEQKRLIKKQEEEKRRTEEKRLDDALMKALKEKRVKDYSKR